MSQIENTREAVDAAMREHLPSTWVSDNEAREAFIRETGWRRSAWDLDGLMDAWVWFRIGFTVGRKYE